jgi:hypothetical protein
MPLSLPKQKIHVLLLEGVNDSAVRLFEANGYSEVERLPKALGTGDLKAALSGVHMLGIRSAPTRSISIRRGGSAFPCSTRRIPTPVAWPS